MTGIKENDWIEFAWSEEMKRYFLILIAALGILAFSGGCSSSSVPAGDEKDTDYAGGLFDTSELHTIDIQFAPEDWTDLMTRPATPVFLRLRKCTGLKGTVSKLNLKMP